MAELPPPSPPWLSAITLRGFKSFDRLEQFPLEAINVFIGANGVGKSNFISFFEFLRSIVAGDLSRRVAADGGANLLLHHGAKRTPELSFELEFLGGANGYRLSLGVTAQDGLTPIEEVVSFWDRQKYPRPFEERLFPGPSEAAIQDAFHKGAAWWVHREILGVRRYHFHDTGSLSALRRTSDLNDNLVLASDGANLASYLYLLREKHAPQYQAILHALRRVAPFMRDLVLDPLPLSPGQTRLRWRHADTDMQFDVSALSDGTLRFLALATVLLQPPRADGTTPQMVIIDEPELGLHPVAIRLLGAMIRSSAARRQLLVSTQSPLLIDEFEPEHVVVADLEQGATRLRRLTVSQLGGWLEEYSLGELWEKNELGGRPR
jgi:predicted ATPase